MSIKIVPLFLAAVLAIGCSFAVSERPSDDYTEHPSQADDYKSIFALIVRGKCGVIPGRTTTPEMDPGDSETPFDEDRRVMREEGTASENGSIDGQGLGGVVGSFGEFIDECQYHDGVAIEGFETLPPDANITANITAPSSVWYCCPGKLLAYFDSIAIGCKHSIAGDTASHDGYCGDMLSAGLSVVTQYGRKQTICCGPQDNFLDNGYL